MKSYSSETYDPAEVVHELTQGAGAVKFTGLFPDEDIAKARAIIMQHSDTAAPKVTHFQGAAEEAGKIDLQRRVWNLLAKGEVFSRMAAHPVLMDCLRAFLGSEFIMGSIAANRILPGGPGQEPHVDYPYWDYYKADSFPHAMNASFPLNAQVTIVLDPFTEASGATAFAPGSQKELVYPSAEDFEARAERMLADPGDTVLFFGAVWHCAMPNKSTHDRNAVLSQYLPKFVKPMEDMPAALPPEFVANASPDMRQLLGLNYPYPEVLDAAKAGNTEGKA